MWKERLLALYPSLKDNILISALAGLGLILFGYGVIAFLAKPSEQDVIFESSNSTSDKSQNGKIIIDIEGAVVVPGVYDLNLDARVKDAFVAASGLAQDADRDWVSKNINLAAKLTDSAKIYIPRVGDPTSIRSSGQGGMLVYY